MSTAPSLKAGNYNLRGKKSKVVMSGGYVAGVLVDRRDELFREIAASEMRYSE